MKIIECYYHTKPSEIGFFVQDENLNGYLLNSGTYSDWHAGDLVEMRLTGNSFIATKLIERFFEDKVWLQCDEDEVSYLESFLESLDPKHASGEITHWYDCLAIVSCDLDWLKRELESWGVPEWLSE